MPIIRNASGQSQYIAVGELFFAERPQDFFDDNDSEDSELKRRLAEARYRVIETIRFADNPLTGIGTCHEIHGIGSELEDLTNFVDIRDGRRAQLLKTQRAREESVGLAPHERRRRSPQPLRRRRSALFSGTDIPKGHFFRQYGLSLSRYERARFVDLMRWHLFHAAIEEMYANNEIARLNDVWYIKVSVMDVHPSARRQRRRKSARSSHRVKDDDRSFHGMPNCARGRSAA